MKRIRTDLALEIRESLPKELDGVEMAEYMPMQNIKATKVRIWNEKGQEAMQKPMGKYFTFDLPCISKLSQEEREVCAACLAKELQELLPKEKAKNILIVGLGNRNVTPDALGPLVAENVFITRHIKTYLPDAMDQETISLSAIAPGVLGITGLETGEVIQGIVQTVKPDLILAIDSLAARKISRLGASIQISDTGIAPGSGIGNQRKEITEQNLGVKVIAIGVPMVTFASTIAVDLMEQVFQEEFETVSTQIRRVLSQDGENMIVTPDHIDLLVKNTAKLLARIINLALYPHVSDAMIQQFS